MAARAVGSLRGVLRPGTAKVDFVTGETQRRLSNTAGVLTQDHLRCNGAPGLAKQPGR
jgi:hypothetical protein